MHTPTNIHAVHILGQQSRYFSSLDAAKAHIRAEFAALRESGDLPKHAELRWGKNPLDVARAYTTEAVGEPDVVFEIPKHLWEVQLVRIED